MIRKISQKSLFIQKQTQKSTNKKLITFCDKQGHSLLHDPILNKGLCYNSIERDRLGLRGLMPGIVRTIEQQESIFLLNYQSGWEDIAQQNLNQYLIKQGVTPDFIRQWQFLKTLQQRNQVLYYKIIRENFDELIKIISIPTVQWVAQHFSLMYHRAKGMYFSALDKGNMAAMVYNWPHDKLDFIVITDGTNSMKDQGIGGMAIVQSTLDIYIAAGAFKPRNVMSAFLDVGTNNKELIESNSYIGLKQPRLPYQESIQLLDEFMQAVNLRWPNVMVQFEDFDQRYARQIKKRYENDYLVFNDLEQSGTALLSALFGCLRSSKQPFKEIINQKYLIYYNSSQFSDLNTEILYDAMLQYGLTIQQAKDRFYFVNENGIVSKASRNIQNSWVQGFARQEDELLDSLNLQQLAEIIKPTVLIITHEQKNMLTEKMIKQLCKYTQNPFIFHITRAIPDVEPLQIIQWSNGNAYYASRMSYDEFQIDGKSYISSQVKKSYIYPGLTMGQSICGVPNMDKSILIQAARAVTLLIKQEDLCKGACFPQQATITEVTKQVATHVIMQNFYKKLIHDKNLLKICQQGFDAVENYVQTKLWDPEYSHMVYYDK